MKEVCLLVRSLSRVSAVAGVGGRPVAGWGGAPVIGQMTSSAAMAGAVG